MILDEWKYNDYELCSSCAGTGTYDIGDCEDGVLMVCPECEGCGEVKI